MKGRAPKTGYEREQFGPAWKDVDRNGCDQRNDILARDLEGETFKPGTHDCIVLTGTLHDLHPNRRCHPHLLTSIVPYPARANPGNVLDSNARLLASCLTL